jgi:hypothetical protein
VKVLAAYSFGCIDREGIAIYKSKRWADECHLRQGPEITPRSALVLILFSTPPTTEILDAIKQVTAEFWPGIPVIPIMSTGATDGTFLRNVGIPVYGTSGLTWRHRRRPRPRQGRARADQILSIVRSISTGS